MNKEIEIEYLKKEVKIHKDFGDTMYKMSMKNLNDFSFWAKINIALHLCWFLMGIAFGIRFT